VRLIILSNLTQKKSVQEIVGQYLLHWPNLEEAFGDYSRKIEFFTYAANAQHFLSAERLPLEKNLAADLKGLFAHYPELLDLYVRWHLLPPGYENKDFLTTKAQFYNLPCRLHRQRGLTLATFLPVEGYAFLQDLQYACRRLNEKEIFLPEGNRLWCEVSLS